ncbi:MAG: hypothetical protein AAGA02_01510 [Bacteroidota bacterium]
MKTKKTAYLKLSIIDGILHCNYDKQDVVDLNKAKIMVSERVAFCEEKTWPHLFDISSLKKITKDARDYLADEGNRYVTASAIIVNSPVLKMIANFFITVNRPKSPTRMFTNKNSALNWLSQYKEISTSSDQSNKVLQVL